MKSRSRTMAAVSSVAVVALVCFVLGFVALNHEARFSNAVATVHAEAVPVQARRSNIETSVVSHLMKLEETTVNDEAKFQQDLKNLVASDGAAEAVTRKQMQEISGKIASAVRASHNSMDVRHLQEIGSPKPCGPKRVGVPTTKAPRRPCIPRPSPTPPNAVGVCKLCVVYQFPVTDAAKDTICKPSTAASILTVLNSALLNKFPALFNQIGGDVPTCVVEKQGQVQYAIHGPYCRGPVDPADYPDSETLSTATQAVQSKTVALKLATTQSSCAAPDTYATTVTPVGTSIQFLTVTLECDDGQGVAPNKVAAAC